MQRWLNRNEGSEVPSNFLFFDTESHEPQYHPDGTTKELSVRLWVAIACRVEGGKVSRRVVQRGHSPAEFWKFLYSRTDPGRPLWVIAHNLGFDWTMVDFWAELWARRFDLGPWGKRKSIKEGEKDKRPRGILCAESSPTFAVVKHEGRKIKFTDTHNYWPIKLEEIAPSYGLQKLEMPDWAETDDAWFAYCERDVEVCERAFISLVTRWEREECGVFQLTGPMLAMTNYRHTTRCLTRDGTRVNISMDNEHPSIPLERESYLGGWIETFRFGEVEGPVYELDANSLYPAMMEANPFPNNRVSAGSIKTPADLWNVMQAYGAVATVKVKARGNVYPVVWKGTQLHATGTFWTTLAGPELMRALTNGDVERVAQVQTYSLQNLFREWVATWYGRKLDARERGEEGRGDYEFCQLILRSLSAKWAQGGRFWSDRLDMGYAPEWEQFCEYDYDAEKVKWFRSVAGVYQELITKHEPQFSFPAISSYITSYAREYMRMVIQSLPARSVFHTNTDSLIVDERGYRALKRGGLIDDRTLGFFRLKGKYPNAAFLANNCYRLGEKWKRSGLHGGKPKFKGKQRYSEQWQNLASILARYPAGRVLIKDVPWEESKMYPKGKLGKDGWTTPFWLTDDPEFSDRPPTPPEREARSSPVL